MHMYIGGAEIAFGRPSCSVRDRQNALYVEKRTDWLSDSPKCAPDCLRS